MTAPAPRPASGLARWRRPCCWSRPPAKALIGSEARRCRAGMPLPPPARAACRPIDDKRGTIVYRTKIAGVLLKRTAAIAARQARETEVGNLGPWQNCTFPPRINGEPMEFLCEPHAHHARRAARTAGADRLQGRLFVRRLRRLQHHARRSPGLLLPDARRRGRRPARSRTIEGMADGDDLHPLQQKFLELAALQCGICTSGMLVASDALLRKNPEPERRRRCASGLPATSAAAPAMTRSFGRFWKPPPNCRSNA